MYKGRNACPPLWLIPFIVLPHASEAGAARQGSLGGTSSGSIAISVSVPAQARVSGLDDIAFVDADSETLLRATRDICVSSNSRARAFTVAAIGSGTNGSLELSNETQTIAYSVGWSWPDNRNSDALPSMGPARRSIGAAATELDCRSGLGLVRLTVAMDQPRLRTDGPETPYTGTLTLILSPQ